jgi:hypothetical protein
MDVTAPVDSAPPADTPSVDDPSVDTEPIIRFDDDEVAAVAQLVPRYGYEEAERILDTAVRTHRRLDSLVPTR